MSSLLHAIRRAGSRALNDTTTELVLSAKLKEMASPPKPKRSRAKPAEPAEDAVPTPADEAPTKLKRGRAFIVEPPKVDVELDLVARNLLQGLKSCKNGAWTWTSEHTLAYHYTKRSFEAQQVVVPSGMCSAYATFAFQQYKRYIKEIRQQGISRTLPSFGNNAPIFIRAAEWSFVSDPGGFALEIVMSPNPPLRLALAAPKNGHGGRKWESYMRQMKELTREDTTWKHGDLKLKWDAERRKWFAIISYAHASPEKAAGALVVVHRGIVHFLYGMSANGESRRLVDGGDMHAYKRQMLSRQQSLGRHRPELGESAHGHGWRRREKALCSLKHKEESWVDTKCKQAAARVIELAETEHAKMVVIEDYGTIDDNALEDSRAGWLAKRWPWAQQKAAIAWACEKAGLALLEIPAQYISQDCPQCGVRCENHDDKRGTFRCTSCGYERPIDYVNTLHMLNRANRALAHVGAADAIGGWTIIETKGKERIQYLPCTWTTQEIAQRALDDLLEPWPPNASIRTRFLVDEVSKVTRGVRGH